MISRIEKKEIMDRLKKAGVWEEADHYREEVRQRLREDGKNKQEAVEGAWDVMDEKYEPIMAREEAASDDQPPQLPGMPDNTDSAIDPEYTETDPGKQLRDGLLWAALEFERVIRDTDSGPVATIPAASTLPPNAYGLFVLRTYALSPLEKRRDLIGRSLAFATKAHDNNSQSATGDGGGGFLHELDGWGDDE